MRLVGTPRTSIPTFSPQLRLPRRQMAIQGRRPPTRISWMTPCATFATTRPRPARDDERRMARESPQGREIQVAEQRNREHAHAIKVDEDR